MADFVIVGAGECGARAAFALREKGFDGTITLIGNEDHLPYERPPLSKEALVAGDGPKLVADAERYAAAGIAVLCGRPVIEIDRTARRVLLGDGTAVPYDKCCWRPVRARAACRARFAAGASPPFAAMTMPHASAPIWWREAISPFSAAASSAWSWRRAPASSARA